MIHEYTRDNILELLNNIPAAGYEQLCIFFEGELERAKTRILLEDLTSTGRLIYNENNECYYERFSHLKRASVLKEYIDAFWPIALMGSEEVRFVSQCYYPMQYFVVTENEGVFTFNLCKDVETARVGAITRDMMKFKGETDDIRHIAVVKNLKIIKDIIPYGYESYALIHPEAERVEDKVEYYK